MIGWSIVKEEYIHYFSKRTYFCCPVYIAEWAKQQESSRREYSILTCFPTMALKQYYYINCKEIDEQWHRKYNFLFLKKKKWENRNISKLTSKQGLYFCIVLPSRSLSFRHASNFMYFSPMPYVFWKWASSIVQKMCIMSNQFWITDAGWEIKQILLDQ